MKKLHKRGLSLLISVIMALGAMGFISLPVAAAGNTYYVDDVAANGTGTLASPFNSVATGVSKLVAGDTLYIRAGTYAVDGVTLAADGTVNNPITIAAYGSEKPVFSKPNTQKCFTITGDNWIIKGIKIYNYKFTDAYIADPNGGLPALETAMFKVSDAVDGLTLENVVVDTTSCVAVWLNGAKNVNIKNCDLYRNGHYARWACGGEAAGGIYINNCENVTVEGCRLYHNSGAGIRIKGTVGNVDIKNNWIIRSGFDYHKITVKPFQYDDMTGENTGSGIFMDGGNKTGTRTWIGFNLLLGNRLSGFEALGSRTQHIILTHNTTFGNRQYSIYASWYDLVQRIKGICVNNLSLDTGISNLGGITEIETNQSANSNYFWPLIDELKLIALPTVTVINSDDVVTAENMLVARAADGSLPNTGVLKPKTDSPLVAKMTNGVADYKAVGADNPAFAVGGFYDQNNPNDMPFFKTPYLLAGKYVEPGAYQSGAVFGQKKYLDMSFIMAEDYDNSNYITTDKQSPISGEAFFALNLPQANLNSNMNISFTTSANPDLAAMANAKAQELYDQLVPEECVKTDAVQQTINGITMWVSAVTWNEPNASTHVYKFYCFASSGNSGYYTLNTNNDISSAAADTIMNGIIDTIKITPISVAVPGGFKAVSGGYDRINVSWAAVSGATSYELSRAYTASGAKTVIKTGNVLSFVDTARTFNTTYFYFVRAMKAQGLLSGISNYSAAVSAKPVLATVVAKAESASFNSIKVSWPAVAGASGYEVSKSTASTSGFTVASTVTGLSATLGSLITGKTYYVKVRAYRLVGATKVFGSYSSVVSTKPVPAAPVAQAVKVTATSIKVSWAAVAGASGYEVVRSKYSTFASATTKIVSTTSLTASSLSKTTTYYFKVRAYKLVGTTKVYGAYSTMKSART